MIVSFLFGTFVGVIFGIIIAALMGSNETRAHRGPESTGLAHRTRDGGDGHA